MILTFSKLSYSKVYDLQASRKHLKGLIYNIKIKSYNFYTTLLDTTEIVLTYFSPLPINSIQFPHSVFPDRHSNYFCRATEQNTGT